MPSVRGEDGEAGEEVVFVQEAIDYHITGSRHWDDLDGSAQDEYLLACFMGEGPRIQLEKGLDLFGRVGSSVADGLLGPFRQYDIDTGTSHYQPESPARAQRVLGIRLTVLKDTPLGERLSLARARQLRGKLPAEEYFDDPVLKFYSVGPRGTAGLDILGEDSVGGFPNVDPYRGPWGDWSALELHQAKEYSAAKHERWERETNEPPVTTLLSGPPAVVVPPRPPVPQPPTPVQRRVPVGPVVIASAMLLWALVPVNPYGYYVLLRWVCSALFLYLALIAHERVRNIWPLAFGIGVLVYNPVFPLPLGRPLWSAINVVTIVLLGSFTLATRVRK